MLIVPVIDLKDGIVVRAVAGRRDAYQPLEMHGKSTVELAREMIATTGADAIYVADLDLVLGNGTNRRTWEELADSLGVDCFVDAGLRTPDDVKNFPDHPRLIPVLGTETMVGPDAARAAKELDAACAVSIDMRGGTLMGPWEAWSTFGVTHDRAVAELTHAATTLSDAGIVILLDLAGVGMGKGPLAEVHLPAVRQAMRWRQGELWIGGGIRDRADVERLQAAGADGVLASSAIHAGKL